MLNIGNKYALIKIKKARDKSEYSIKAEEKIVKKRIRPRNFWPLSKIAGRFVVWYFLAILIGTILLASPLALSKLAMGGNVSNHNYKWDFISSLFTSSSAFSDTGLTVVNVAANYNFFGQLIIAILIEIGGFGILTFKVMLFIFIGKKLTLKDRLLAQGERGGTSLGSTIQLIKSGFLFLIYIELISTIALFAPFYFYHIPSGLEGSLDIHPYHNFIVSLWSSIFHSVSAINNAGFDIIGKDSLKPYDHLYIIQFIFMFEFVMGGIGFPTFYDITQRIKNKYNKVPSRLSLFTKLNLITYFLVSITGLSLVFIVESNASNPDSIYHSSTDPFNYFMNVFFNVMSTRNAGFSTVGMNGFQYSSKLIMSIMMFIGSAPSSTAGGIRTTTFSIIVLTIVAVARNSEVSAFKRKIPTDTVRRAFAVFILSIFLLIGLTGISLALYSSDGKYGDLTYIDILFIFSSAFGTTGLSTLSTSQMLNLYTAVKIFLILLMIIGQIGISNVLSMFKTKNKNEYKLIEESITIG